MAGGKETPRQKMIGLMYLVLMALLAMNVSKEIINAFITLNNKIESQNHTFEISNNQYATVLNNSLIQAKNEAGLGELDNEAAYAKAKEEGKDSYVKIYELNVKADSILSITKTGVNGVMDLAQEMLNAGVAGEWVVETETGFKKIADLGDHENPYGKKDDYDTPTRMMVDEGKGDVLLESVYNFRDALITKIGEVPIDGKTVPYTPIEVTKANNEDTAHIEAFIAALPDSIDSKRKNAMLEVYNILTFPEKVDNHGEEYTWVQGQFDHSPMVAAAAIFTSIKGQMLQAQGVALAFLASQNDVPPFKFDTIEPKAFAATGYINSGDSLGLQIMIAAYDSKAEREIEYWVDDTTRSAENKLVLDPNAKSITLGREHGNGVGEHKVVGRIAVEENGAKKWKDWSFDYKVGAPTSAIGNAEMNIMYIGYSNQIVASGSGYSDVNATCSGCTSWGKNGDVYLAKVGRPGKVTVSVSGKDKEGKTVSIGSQEFRAIPMPRPRVYVIGVDPFASKISRTALARASFTSKLVGSPLTIASAVTGGVVTVTVSGVSKSYPFSGFRMPAGASQIISQLRPGATVMIEPKATLGGVPVKPAAVSYKVQ